MKKSFITIISSVFLVMFFSGCTKPCIQPSFPDFERKSPTKLMWTDIKYSGEQVHMLNSYEWDYIQTELIDAGIKANMCADIINNYNNRIK